MISDSEIKKSIQFSITKTVYQWAYIYRCSNGHIISFIKRDKNQKCYQVRRKLLPIIKNYLAEHGLEA